MLIIPAIDIIENSVVRLTEGKYDDVKIYSPSPLEQAKKYNDLGFEWLHMVDLIASRDGSINVSHIIDDIKSQTELKLEFGGGIRKSEDVDNLIKAKVDRVVIGSMTVKYKQDFVESVLKHGRDKIIVASDVLNNFVHVKGWTEDSGITIYDHIEYCLGLNLSTFLVTDISKDGLLQGPSIELYQNLKSNYPEIKLIASGGVSSINDLNNLRDIGCYAAVVGKAIYENKINLRELSEFGR